MFCTFKADKLTGAFHVLQTHHLTKNWTHLRFSTQMSCINNVSAFIAVPAAIVIHCCSRVRHMWGQQARRAILVAPTASLARSTLLSVYSCCALLRCTTVIVDQRIDKPYLLYITVRVQIILYSYSGNSYTLEYSAF